MWYNCFVVSRAPMRDGWCVELADLDDFAAGKKPLEEFQEPDCFVVDVHPPDGSFRPSLQMTPSSTLERAVEVATAGS